MGLFDKFKNFVGIEDIEDDDDDEGEEAAAGRSLIPETKTEGLRTGAGNPAPVRPVSPAAQSRPAAAQPSRYTSKDMKLVVMEPQSFEESSRLVDSLKAKKPVIINLENLETDVARKIFDFLSGATYALNGNMQKVANNIFIFAPENVDVSYNMGTVTTEQVKSPWK